MKSITLILDKGDIDGTKYEQVIKVGDLVRAFHPQGFSVLLTGEVTKITNDQMQIKFDDRRYWLPHSHITQLVWSIEAIPLNFNS